jgi:sialate O-acetylesterase
MPLENGDHVKHRILFPAFLLLFASTADAEIRLPAVIGDHAMFQADTSVAIWGWAAPSEAVKVSFVPTPGAAHSAPQSFVATADTHGKWSGKLPALSSGTAGQLRITASGEPDKTVNDILVGEVWLASGQSNMEYDLAASGRMDPTIPGEAAEVAQNVLTAQGEADTAMPPIRYFHVAAKRAQQPLDDVKGEWVLIDSKHVPRVSAVAWNFAVTLQNKLHVPVAIIVSSVGNTPVETWMSRETLSATSVGAGVYERSRQDLASSPPEKIAQYMAALKAWRAANPTPELQSQNRSSRPVAPPNPSADNYVPNQYYDGMIFGLEPYTLRGVIWYQGTGNMAHATEYAEMFTALIQEWRREWNSPQLPFYFVEESGYGAKQNKPVEPNGVSIIREQQHTALSLPQVGMIGSIDLGNGNPHYPNKRPVGERLAGLALHGCYHQPGKVMGPMYQSFSVEGDKVRLKFSDADGLRAMGNGTLMGFAIRSDKGDWVWASGRIDGQEIVVWSDHIRKPVAVRYAWAVNPVISVENGAGLPLYPFRTDIQSKE